MVNFFGTETSPSSRSSSPTIMRKRVVLPAPLGPTRPTFSPGLSWNDASTNTSCLPYCLLMLEREIIRNYQASRTPDYSISDKATRMSGFWAEVEVIVDSILHFNNPITEG